MSPTLHDVLSGLSAVVEGGPLPEPPYEAFIEALARLDLLRVDDPALSDPRAQVALAFAWARFSLEAWQQVGFYVDPLAAQGGHRVYGRDEASLPGGRWFRFDGLTQAAQWLVGTLQGRRPSWPELEDDAWEQACGVLLFDAAVEALDLVAGGTPIEGMQAQPVDSGDRSPGWSRRLLVAVAEHSAAGRGAALRPADLHALPASARRLVEQLVGEVQ